MFPWKGNASKSGKGNASKSGKSLYFIFIKSYLLGKNPEIFFN